MCGWKVKNRKSMRGRKREKNTVSIWRNENGVGVRDSYKKQVFGMMEIRNLTRLANTALRIVIGAIRFDVYERRNKWICARLCLSKNNTFGE